MIGIVGETLPDTLYTRPTRARFCVAFRLCKTPLSIPDHYSSIPLLQQPRELRTGFWPPSRGLQEKPRPLGVDSFLIQEDRGSAFPVRGIPGCTVKAFLLQDPTPSIQNSSFSSNQSIAQWPFPLQDHLRASNRSGEMEPQARDPNHAES